MQEVDLGARSPAGVIGRALSVFAIGWSIYQIYVGSPLPAMTHIAWLSENEQRPIHLAAALLLVFCIFPASRAASRRRVPWYDWMLAATGIVCVLYNFAFYERISLAAGGTHRPTEVVLAILGILTLLEATRRVLGVAFVLIVLIALGYAFAGPYMPDLIAHGGVTLNRAIDHIWFATEGVFGIPLGVSNTYIFLFVLFGAMLEKGGAGNYFIQLSFALLGHLRGGPAKAAVVSSGMTGLISGSALANIVTTGTFTIPLMKRMGFSAERAAAVETASSINGQIMPPVMGAAAFLMTEFIGMPYVEVIKHAFVPAIISYIALYYIVHVEAIKAGLPVLTPAVHRSAPARLANFVVATVLFLAGCAGIYFAITWIKEAFGEHALMVAIVSYGFAYVGLLLAANRFPKLVMDDPNAPLVRTPPALATFMAGLHYLLPIVVLVWCLVVERRSAGVAVAWAIGAIIIVVVTQHPLLAILGGERRLQEGLRQGVSELLSGLEAGARNMVGIAVALAAAGIIVGVVSMTGIGLAMASVVEAIAGNDITMVLIATAIMCVILGMGLPTTANYIVVVAVMAQPIVQLASQAGLIIPPIAVHLFVFYLGLISGTTPPVAVDAFCAAALARANPLRTAGIAFVYNMRTIILPFFFVFNTDLLLIGIESWWHLLLTVAGGIVAMLAFAAATLRYFVAPGRWWESVVLLLVTFTLLRPSAWVDPLFPPYEEADPRSIVAHAERQPDGASIRLWVSGDNFSGEPVRKVVLLPLGDAGAGSARLARNTGMVVAVMGEETRIVNVRPASPAAGASIAAGWQIQAVQVPLPQPNKHWLYLPAFALFALVGWSQRRRRALGT
ncbi:MAG: TRAP transporter fused permease subunit [Alphaproteobacteria bacterium]|nr:TRAP transporter fused permease subunit [Alphaproteobacteria bacterium]